MDMQLRKELRDFISWQIENDMFKGLIVPYEVAEDYLEAKAKTTVEEEEVFEDCQEIGCEYKSYGDTSLCKWHFVNRDLGENNK